MDSYYCSGPSFGRGPDLYICDNSNINASSSSKLGSTYDNSGLDADKNLIGEGGNKLIEEIEVFTVKMN